MAMACFSDFSINLIGMCFLIRVPLSLPPTLTKEGGMDKSCAPAAGGLRPYG